MGWDGGSGWILGGIRHPRVRLVGFQGKGPVMYVGIGAEPIRISGRPPLIEKPPEQPPPPGDGDLVPSWARGLIAVGLVGGALVFLMRVAEENEKLGWKARF